MAEGGHGEVRVIYSGAREDGVSSVLEERGHEVAAGFDVLVRTALDIRSGRREAALWRRDVLQGHPRRDLHVIAVGPDDGDGVICHGTAPGQAGPPDRRDLASDLENEVEALGRLLRGGNAVRNAGVSDGVGVEAALELIAIVERLDVILAGYWWELASEPYEKSM